MIRLNRMTDYGVVVLAQMACVPNDVVTAPKLAKETSMPLPAVSKMLKALARHGLVESYRGAAGGYSLGRAPEEITVAEIIVALEGPIALTACVEGAEAECGIESLCPMRGNWDRVNWAIRQALGSVTLAEMARPMIAPAGGRVDVARRAGAVA